MRHPYESIAQQFDFLNITKDSVYGFINGTTYKLEDPEFFEELFFQSKGFIAYEDFLCKLITHHTGITNIPKSTLQPQMNRPTGKLIRNTIDEYAFQAAYSCPHLESVVGKTFTGKFTQTTITRVESNIFMISTPCNPFSIQYKHEFLNFPSTDIHYTISLSATDFQILSYPFVDDNFSHPFIWLDKTICFGGHKRFTKRGLHTLTSLPADDILAKKCTYLFIEAKQVLKCGHLSQSRTHSKFTPVTPFSLFPRTSQPQYAEVIYESSC